MPSELFEQNSSDLVVRPVSGLVLLQLLLPLTELALRVAGVAAEAVTVEVVIAAGLSERLSLLKTNRTHRSSRTSREHITDTTTSYKWSRRRKITRRTDVELRTLKP